jgi:heme exporter protein A
VLEADGDVLEADGLAARRGYATLFRDVTFSLREGDGLAVTGPNGSGKTTLLRMVAGLTAPVEGELRWRGEGAAPFAQALRDAVLFNGHLPALKDELSAEENLDAWLRLDGGRVAHDTIAQALHDVGLARQRRLPARVLSQGQRRRIALARLRLASRPLWILDEPATALDTNGLALLAALVDAHLDAGGLCIMATHQPLVLQSTRVQSLELHAAA